MRYSSPLKFSPILISSKYSRDAIVPARGTTLSTLLTHHQIFFDSDWFKLLTWRESARAGGETISPYNPSNIFPRAWLAYTRHVTEYAPT